ncbi:MAG: hypothetical protein KIH62_000310 [Candidatus Kerfeldbacteria bacterium]|nr:hypothetical protein [Candidatus Kerfeldbacteria bacterium]
MSLHEKFGLPDVNSPLRRGYYVRLEEAAKRLREREHLRAEVSRFWEEQKWGAPPIPVNDCNLAVISRNLATARFEDIVYAALARQAGLEPVWSTLNGDKMCAGSPIKTTYLQGHLVLGRGGLGGLKLEKHEYLEIVDPRSLRGRPANSSPAHRHHNQPLFEIFAPNGTPLTTLHRVHQMKMLAPICPRGVISFDITSWYRDGNLMNSRQYYIALMSLFVAHGVLFEDFHGGESGEQLDAFTAEVFQPASRRLKDIFGVAPLVVPLPWKREYAYYPSNTSWPEWNVVPPEYLNGLL